LVLGTTAVSSMEFGWTQQQQLAVIGKVDLGETDETKLKYVDLIFPKKNEKSSKKNEKNSNFLQRELTNLQQHQATTSNCDNRDAQLS